MTMVSTSNLFLFVAVYWATRALWSIFGNKCPSTKPGQQNKLYMGIPFFDALSKFSSIEQGVKQNTQKNNIVEKQL